MRAPDPTRWPSHPRRASAEARALCLGLLERAGVPVGGPEPWSLQVHDERLWDRVVAQHSLGLGEAYLDGWWDCDRIDEMLTRLLVSDAAEQLTPSVSHLVAYVRSRWNNRPTLEGARRNASHHYDIGDDLYERMLDRRMVYSCGYWRRADDLDAAQEAKLELVCQKLQLQPGLRVLDIGCGWGAFAEHAAHRHGVHVTGISPAANQVAAARERCAGLPVVILQCDYREVTGQFDRIVSVGMLEHVGASHLITFVQACDRHLAPDGVMLHHFIGKLRSTRRADPWFDRYIFPGGWLPSLGRVARACEPGWVIEDVQNLGPDYDRTLLAWFANIEAAWDDLPGYDERFRRMWRYYLMASAAGFRARQNQLFQVVLRRPGVASRYDAPR